MKVSRVIYSCSLALILFGRASGKNTAPGEVIDPQPAVAVAADLMIQAEKQQAARTDADNIAPKTLRRALLDVSDAVASSVLLNDVMDVILNAPGTPENVALKIVR